MGAQGSEVSCEAGVAVNGDIVIGIWTGGHTAPWDEPSCAYAFHTAFQQAGVLRVPADDLDFPGVLKYSALTGPVSMDIVLEEESTAQNSPNR